jgi:hypothetical protein
VAAAGSRQVCYKPTETLFTAAGARGGDDLDAGSCTASQHRRGTGWRELQTVDVGSQTSSLRQSEGALSEWIR